MLTLVQHPAVDEAFTVIQRTALLPPHSVEEIACWASGLLQDNMNVIVLPI